MNDAYEGMNPVPILLEEPFLRNVLRVLRPGGVYSTNMLSEGLNERAEKGIAAVFGAADKMRVEGTMNTWIIGAKREGAGAAGGGEGEAGQQQQPQQAQQQPQKSVGGAPRSSGGRYSPMSGSTPPPGSASPFAYV